MRQRTKLVLNVGNSLELLGAACGVYGVDRLVGFAWALILAAVLLIVAAEFVYGEDPHAPVPGTPRVVRVPLPLRPQPSRWLKERRQAWAVRRATLPLKRFSRESIARRLQTRGGYSPRTARSRSR